MLSSSTTEIQPNRYEYLQENARNTSHMPGSACARDSRQLAGVPVLYVRGGDR